MRMLYEELEIDDSSKNQGIYRMNALICDFASFVQSTHNFDFVFISIFSPHIIIPYPKDNGR